MNKKGQIIQMLSGITVSVLVISIVLVVGFLIMKESKDIVYNDLTTVSVSNEPFVYTNNTIGTLVFSPGSITLDCTVVYNGTSGETATVIPSTAYECDTWGINIESNTTFNTTVSVSYTRVMPDEAWNSTSDLQVAVSDIPGWIPVIIITMIGAGLISLVAIFRRR